MKKSKLSFGSGRIKRGGFMKKRYKFLAAFLLFLFTTTVLASDTDGDGIPDCYDDDIDGDGIPNITEEQQGTDPYDPIDYLPPEESSDIIEVSE